MPGTVPPQNDAGTRTALNQIYKAISKQENAHPEAALLVAGDFNAGKLKSVLHHFYQHVKCATRGKKTIDNIHSTHRDAYKALLHPPFGKPDHNSNLLIPAYKLQDSFARTEWNTFQDSSNGIEEYTTSVIGFINNGIPILTVRT